MCVISLVSSDALSFGPPISLESQDKILPLKICLEMTTWSFFRSSKMFLEDFPHIVADPLQFLEGFMRHFVLPRVKINWAAQKH